MKCPMSTFAVLALSVLTGCARTKEIEIWARVVQDGAGRRHVEIDRSEEHHEWAVVEPGDRIVWACREWSDVAGKARKCPAEIKFAVEDIHFVADLEQLVKTLRQPAIADPEKLNALGQELQREATAATAAEGKAGETAAPEAGGREQRAAATLMSGQVRFERAMGDMIRVVRVTKESPPDVRIGEPKPSTPSVNGPEQPTLFKGGWLPPADQLADGTEQPRYTSGNKRLPSVRVADGLGHGVWKFTWRVKLVGDPEDKAQILDPHIYTHPDPKSQ